MTDIERKELEEIVNDFKESWKDYEKIIKSVEKDNPDFKVEYDKKSDYTNYIFKQGFYAGISYAHGTLEKFLNKYNWIGGD